MKQSILKAQQQRAADEISIILHGIDCPTMSSEMSRELEAAGMIMRVTWTERLSKENGNKKDYLYSESWKKLQLIVSENWSLTRNIRGSVLREVSETTLQKKQKLLKIGKLQLKIGSYGYPWSPWPYDEIWFLYENTLQSSNFLLTLRLLRLID